MFTSLTDFSNKPYRIVSSTELSVGLAQFISDKEVELLKDLLGITFYNALAAGVTALPADWVNTAPTVINQLYVYGSSIWKALTIQTGIVPVEGADWEEQPLNRWLKLRAGYIFTASNGIKYNWLGMKDLLIPAIHAEYLRAYSHRDTESGVVVPSVENAEVSSPARKIWESWSKYRAKAGQGNMEEDSLYAFLYAMGEEWYFQDVEDSGYDSFKYYLQLNYNEPGSQNVFDL